jgi:archaellum component FlaC
MRAEFNEVKTAHDGILKKAHAAQAELENLERELKRKAKALAEIDAEFAKVRGKLGGFNKFVQELQVESNKLSVINDGLNAIRAQVGA